MRNFSQRFVDHSCVCMNVEILTENWIFHFWWMLCVEVFCVCAGVYEVTSISLACEYYNRDIQIPISWCLLLFSLWFCCTLGEREKKKGKPIINLKTKGKSIIFHSFKVFPSIVALHARFFFLRKSIENRISWLHSKEHRISFIHSYRYGSYQSHCFLLQQKFNFFTWIVSVSIQITCLIRTERVSIS